MRVILMDMEFEKVWDHFPLAEMNTTAAQEHVGEIERHIRTVKERARCEMYRLRPSFPVLASSDRDSDDLLCCHDAKYSDSHVR